jgi:hypothetical protein
MMVLALGVLAGACEETASSMGPAAPGPSGGNARAGIGAAAPGVFGAIAGASAAPGPRGTAVPSRTPDEGAAASGLPCDVQSIIFGKCGTCHSDPPSFSAPMALTTAAQFQAPGPSDKTKKTFELVKTRINAITPSIRMPPTTSPALSAAELATMNAWLDQSAPAAESACALPTSGAGATAPGGDAAVDRTGLECYKFTAHAQGDKDAKFKVGAVQDVYYSFGFAAPWKDTVYGELFIPVIGNPQAIHHWLFYEEPITDGSMTTTNGQHSGGKLLAGWAPGGPAYDFRTSGDVGFELAPSTYALEIHYNSADVNAEDGSGVELCVQTKKPANVAGFSWLGYDQGGVVAATTGLCVPEQVWTGTCAPRSTEPIHLLFITPHLHQSGTHIKAVIDGPSGSRVLIDQPFDFDYQITYPTSEVIMPGETITTTCTYSMPQCFGQATAAEMCYLFTYSYPKGALTDGADWGSLAHGEGTCLGQTTAEL